MCFNYIEIFPFAVILAILYIVAFKQFIFSSSNKSNNVETHQLNGCVIVSLGSGNTKCSTSDVDLLVDASQNDGTDCLSKYCVHLNGVQVKLEQLTQWLSTAEGVLLLLFWVWFLVDAHVTIKLQNLFVIPSHGKFIHIFCVDEFKFEN